MREDVDEIQGLQEGGAHQAGQVDQRGKDNILRLSKNMVKNVAAALKEAGMKSESQYLVEFRLMHNEAGCEVESWLKRTFDLSRKALEGNKGPTLSAVEVKIDEWDNTTMDARSAGRGRPETPTLAFAWACAWILREIELPR